MQKELDFLNMPLSSEKSTSLETLLIVDTETTGLDFSTGDRVIEIGCVEILGREKSGNEFQSYINPEGKDISKEAQEIIDKVIDLEHVDEYYAVKIADVLPMHPDDVRSIFAKERFSLGRDEIDSIIDAVRETTGA